MSSAPNPQPSRRLGNTLIPAIPPGVRTVTLDNGLVIIIAEDHSAPVVSAQAWCRAGSINEGRWLGGGLSHVLEHMLFKGTSTRGAGRIDQEVQDAGGYMNAYTSFDRTVYHIDLPSSGAEVAIDILCDIMQHATIPEDELAGELDVIRREMDMGQDDPGRRAGRRLFETAYAISPYRFTIIGYPDIFNELKREDILAYYREKYVPNNVFLVVAGDIDPGAVEKQIRETFGPARLRPLLPEVLPEEPRQTAPREVIEQMTTELGHVHFSWHIPDLRHPDVPALDVLSVLLGSGRSSRLFQTVREKLGLAHSVDAWTYNPGRPGLFGVSAVVDADRFEPARAAIMAEIERMQTGFVNSAELSKAVKQFAVATLATRKTMAGQAQDLGGGWLAAGDLNFSARYLDAVRQVTPADVQRVARQYCTETNRTLYALLPNNSISAASVRVETSADQPIQKVRLRNGLTLLLKEDHRLPFVEFRAAFKGGVLAESPATNGATALMSRLLLKGTASRTAAELAEQVEAVGGHIHAYGGNNSFGLNLETLKEDFDFGMEIFADVLLNPAFPEAEADRERQIQIAGIRAQQDKLLQRTFKSMRRALFGDTDYGLDNLGTETSVARLQVSDLASHYRRLSAPNNCVLAIYGDIDSKGVLAGVERSLGDWKVGEQAATAPSGDKPTAPGSPVRVIERRDKKQAVIVIGFPGVTFDHPDRYALDLLQESCSDMGSRLFLRIRDELGLAYYVGAQHFPGLLPGYFAFYVGTAPEHLERVESELFKEAELLRTTGLTPEELKRSKAKLIGQKKIARQDISELAQATALDELLGLGYDHFDREDKYLDAVTLDEVKAAAERHLRPERAVIAIIKPE